MRRLPPITLPEALTKVPVKLVAFTVVPPEMLPPVMLPAALTTPGMYNPVLANVEIVVPPMPTVTLPFKAAVTLLVPLVRLVNVAPGRFVS